MGTPADKLRAVELREQALAADLANKYDVAMQLYEESLAMDPFNNSTYIYRSHSRIMAGRHLNESLEDAEKALELKVTGDGYHAKGVVLRDLDRLDEALVAFDEGLKLVGNHDDLRGLLLEGKGTIFSAMASKAFSAQDFAKAADLCGTAHSCWPTESNFLAKRSAARRKLEQWDLAIADAEESLRIHPTTYGYLQKARACSGLGRYTEAIQAADAGLALDEDDEELRYLKFDVLVDQAQGARGQLEYEKAVEFCTHALEIFPNSFCLAIRALCRRWDPIAALQDAEQSIALKPTWGWGHWAKGAVLNNLKRYEEAVAVFNTGLTLVNDPRINIHRDMENGKDHALRMLDQTGKAVTLSGQATLAMRNGDHERAIELYSQAIELDPSSAEIWCLRSSSWLAKQSWDKALKDAQQSVELDPTVDAYCNIAIALRSSGRYSEAVEAFEAAINLGSGHGADSHIHACVEQETARRWSENEQASAEVDDYKQSEESLTTALAFNPCDAMLYASRSRVRIKQQQWSAALHDAEKCLHLQPRTEVGYLQKFEALYGLRDYDKAIETISIAVKDLHVPNVLGGRSAVGDATSGNPSEVSLQGWRDPDQVAADILRMADHTALEMPPRLFSTSTGQFCRRSDMLQTFRTSDAYRRLVARTASGGLVDRTIIRNEVKGFFRYVMLSHRWDISHPEPTHQDIVADVYSLDRTRGIEKLQQFCRTAAGLGYAWAWSDTCCIDKTNSTEVQKSITSMTTWYQRSALTIVHLAGVSDSTPESFKRSDWFTRGWTLQELLSPRSIRFYKDDWTPLLEGISFNHKEHEPIMNWLVEATGIDKESLREFTPGCDVAREKLRWASTRHTSEEEDTAYSLMGIFDIQIPVMYGELKQKALGRLLQEVVGSSGDLSVLQWSDTSGSFSSCLPSDISAFQEEPWKPSDLPDTIIEQSIKRLRHKVRVDSDDFLDFQEKLQSYHPAPVFQHGRLTLTCIVHRVDVLRPVVKRGSPKDNGLYDVQARGLKPFQVTMESTEHLSATSPLRHQRDFIVIRPWNPDFHSGLTHEASRVPERLVLEACVQLEQPFYALLLSRRRRGYYRRVAGAVVEARDVEVLRSILIERLEIF